MAIAARRSFSVSSTCCKASARLSARFAADVPASDVESIKCSRCRVHFREGSAWLSLQKVDLVACTAFFVVNAKVEQHAHKQIGGGCTIACRRSPT